MAPSAAINDFPDGGVVNAEHGSNFNLGATMQIKVSNFYNLVGCKFGFKAIAMLNPVRSIGTLRVPSEVGSAKIRWVAVIMATLETIWAWADESFQNKSVDQRVKMVSFFGQGNLKICFAGWAKDSLGSVFQGFTQTTTPIRPYATLIGNIISGEVWNRFPNFFGGVKILAIHGVALLHRVASGLEPSRCSSTVGARLFITT